MALVLSVPFSAACGGAPAPSASSASESSPEDGPAAGHAAAKPEPAAAEQKPQNAEDAAARQIPTACAGGSESKLCLPPPAFVKRLCAGSFPDVALALFAKGSPFTRGYLSRDTEAWDASGGASASAKLLFEEEVLLLSHRVPDTGGMVVSGAGGGGYDVLRWDGSCASLMSEEVRLRPPGKAKHALIRWKSLDQKMRDALEADEKVGKVAEERRKECKGGTMGGVTPQCEKVDKKLTAAVVAYLRNGGALPPPGPLP
jgi:hypothetical protein